MVRGLRLVASDLTWLLASAAAYGGLDLTRLPVTAAQPAISLPPLLTTFLVIKLARLWTAAAPSSAVQTLYDVIGGVSGGTLADAAQAQGALAAITGWPLTDIAAFTTALGFTFPGNYTQPAAYDALRTLEAMAAAAGATGPQLVNWGADPPDEPTAESIAAGALGVVKAQQPSNDAWLALAATLMNPIRENRSAALQAYLIAQRDASGDLIYADADALFDYFLIDVQMSSCQVTSRVVQAYIAVQIFVERCLMNLEAPQVVVDLTQDDTWNQWEWMSRYRIWEANREVFLYPENWLIESQRPNRTEIYQTLEQEVRQGDSTADYLETVVLNYIDRLDGLAHLLVTGTCEDPGHREHLRGRAHASPIRPSTTCAPSPTVRGPAGRRSRSTSRPTRSFRPCTGAACACSGWMSRCRTSRSRACRPPSNPPRRPLRRWTGTSRSGSTSARSATAAGRRRRRRRASCSTSPSTTRPWSPTAERSPGSTRSRCRRPRRSRGTARTCSSTCSGSETSRCGTSAGSVTRT